MTKEEMFRLQGMDLTVFKNTIPETILGQLLGNAMSVNVIERVIFQALKATQLLPEGCQDKWENGEHISHLYSTIGLKIDSLWRPGATIPEAEM